VALAYCTVLIALMSIATALIQLFVGERKLGRRKGERLKAPKLTATQGMT
jgi:iron(III) transport system permease protein